MRFFRYREQYDLLHRCVLVRNSKYGVVAEIMMNLNIIDKDGNNGS